MQICIWPLIWNIANGSELLKRTPDGIIIVIIINYKLSY